MKLRLTLIIISLLLLTGCAAGQALREINRADYKMSVIMASCAIDADKNMEEAFDKTPPKNKQDIEKVVENCLQMQFEPCLEEKINPMVRSTITDHDLKYKVMRMYADQVAKLLPKLTTGVIEKLSKQYNIKQ